MTPSAPSAPLAPHRPGLLWAVALLSAAVVAYQLVLMHLLAIVQWHHFAAMVIAVALLGFGAGGTALALGRSWFLDRFERVLPALMIACGAAMGAVFALSQTGPVRFDSYLLFVERRQLGALAATYLLFFVPFVLAGTAVGLVLMRETERVGRYYFANLLGSALGGPLAVGLLWTIDPARLPAATALLPLAAGLAAAGRQRGMWVAAAAAAAVVLALSAAPPALETSPYKPISYALNLPDARILAERNSPYGRLRAVAAPALRHAPGLSLTYTGTVETRAAVFNNGNWVGAVNRLAETDTAHALDYATDGLPYVLGRPRRVLLLHAGAGDRAAQALGRGAEEVTIVEPDRALAAMLRGPLASTTDSLLYDPRVAVRPIEPRTFLASEPDDFDLIVVPAVGAFGGTIGLAALQEEALLTREAFVDMWRRLTPGGAFSVTAWMDYPYRHALKLLATLAEALEAAGVERVEEHLAAVRGWGTITFVASRRALDASAVRRVLDWSDRLGFDPALLPGLEAEARARFHQLEDDSFFGYMDGLLGAGRAELYEAYPFRIEPGTDDRPYFSQFLRLRGWRGLAGQFGMQSFPLLEAGYLVAVVTLLQIAVLSVLLIVAPLARIGWSGGGKLRTLVVFGGLGVSFLLVEIVFIQRLSTYLGQPVVATALVLATMLAAAGAGSLVSERLEPDGRRLAWAAGGVGVLLLAAALGLTPALRATIGWAGAARFGVAVVCVAVPGFVMGMPFPLALRRLGRVREAHVPWAWAVNGCLSVVSSGLAALLSVEVGFSAVTLCAALGYLVVAGVGLWSGR